MAEMGQTYDRVHSISGKRPMSMLNGSRLSAENASLNSSASTGTDLRHTTHLRQRVLPVLRSGSDEPGRTRIIVNRQGGYQHATRQAGRKEPFMFVLLAPYNQWPQMALDNGSPAN